MKDARDNRATSDQAYEALRVAQINAETTEKPMKSSAHFCVTEAVAFFNQGMFGYAHEWACESLKYSVGILSQDYQKVRNLA